MQMRKATVKVQQEESVQYVSGKTMEGVHVELKKSDLVARLKGNIVIAPPFLINGIWHEWIPWDEI